MLLSRIGVLISLVVTCSKDFATGLAKGLKFKYDSMKAMNVY